MKLKIMIMALLLVSVGIGSAVNWIPESMMEPGADLSMYAGDPGNIEMWGGYIKNATFPSNLGADVIVYADDTKVYLYSNGTIIDSEPVGTDAVGEMINTSLSDPAVESILFTSLIDIGNFTLSMPEKTVSLRGVGAEVSGIQGIADPLIRSNEYRRVRLDLSNMMIQTNAGNDGAVIKNLYSAGYASRGSRITNCIFNDYDYSNESILLHVAAHGVIIADCTFTSSNQGEYDKSKTIGVQLGVFNDTYIYKAMNVVIDSCNFMVLDHGVRGYETSGVQISNCQIVGCVYGTNFTSNFGSLNSEVVLISHTMIDNVIHPVIFRNIHRPQLTNCYIGLSGNSIGTCAVQLISTVAVGVRYADISHNYIVDYNSNTSLNRNLIYLKSDAVCSVLSHVQIHQNQLTKSAKQGTGILIDSISQNYVYEVYVDNIDISQCNVGINVTSRTRFNYIGNNIFTGHEVISPIIDSTTTRQKSETSSFGSSTGTGSTQTIAHGLAETPNSVSVTPTVTGATATWWADATNIYPTVTNGKTFNWAASM